MKYLLLPQHTQEPRGIRTRDAIPTKSYSTECEYNRLSAWLSSACAAVAPLCLQEGRNPDS